MERFFPIIWFVGNYCHDIPYVTRKQNSGRSINRKNIRCTPKNNVLKARFLAYCRLVRWCWNFIFFPNSMEKMQNDNKDPLWKQCVRTLEDRPYMGTKIPKPNSLLSLYRNINKILRVPSRQQKRYHCWFPGRRLPMCSRFDRGSRWRRSWRRNGTSIWSRQNLIVRHRSIE